MRVWITGLPGALGGVNARTCSGVDQLMEALDQPTQRDRAGHIEMEDGRLIAYQSTDGFYNGNRQYSDGTVRKCRTGLKTQLAFWLKEFES